MCNLKFPESHEQSKQGSQLISKMPTIRDSSKNSKKVFKRNRKQVGTSILNSNKNTAAKPKTKSTNSVLSYNQNSPSQAKEDQPYDAYGI